MLEITFSTLASKDASADVALADSLAKSVANEPSAAIALDSSAWSATTLTDASTSMLFCKDVSATTLVETSAAKSTVNDKSPATLASASALSAACLASASALSADCLAEISADKSTLVTASIEDIVVFKPAISATTIPVGATISAPCKTKSDCLFKTILVPDVEYVPCNKNNSIILFSFFYFTLSYLKFL